MLNCQNRTVLTDMKIKETITKRAKLSCKKTNKGIIQVIPTTIGKITGNVVCLTKVNSYKPAIFLP